MVSRDIDIRSVFERLLQHLREKGGEEEIIWRIREGSEEGREKKGNGRKGKEREGRKGRSNHLHVFVQYCMDRLSFDVSLIAEKKGKKKRNDDEGGERESGSVAWPFQKEGGREGGETKLKSRGRRRRSEKDRRRMKRRTRRRKRRTRKRRRRRRRRGGREGGGRNLMTAAFRAI